MTFVWLLPHDVNPTKDGPLSVFVASSRSLTVSGAGSYQLTITGVGATDQQLLLFFGIANATTPTVEVQIVGVQSSTVYYDQQLAPSSSMNLQTSINGAADVSYTVTMLGQETNLSESVGGGATSYFTTNNGIAPFATVSPAGAVNISLGLKPMAVNDQQIVIMPNSSTTVLYSANGGATWATSTLPSSGEWLVTYGGGAFVAVRITIGTAAAYSTNGGATWTAATLPTSQVWNDVAYGNGTFVAVGNGTTPAAYSTNGGQTWTTSTLSNAGTTVAYGGGHWVVAGSSTATTVSTDGHTWSNGGAMAITASCIAYGNGAFVGVTNTVGTAATVSVNNGTTWTATVLAVSAGYPWVAYTQSGFVAGSGTGIQVNTTGSAAWSTGTAAPSSVQAAICSSPGSFTSPAASSIA